MCKFVMAPVRRGGRQEVNLCTRRACATRLMLFACERKYASREIVRVSRGARIESAYSGYVCESAQTGRQYLRG